MRRFYIFLLPFFFIVIFIGTLSAQTCGTCTQTFSNGSHNVTLTSGADVICITGNVTINGFSGNLGEGGDQICISNGGTLTWTSPNINSGTLLINVQSGGTFNDANGSWNGKITMNNGGTANFTNTSGLTLQGTPGNTITNLVNATMNVSTGTSAKILINGGSSIVNNGIINCDLFENADASFSNSTNATLNVVGEANIHADDFSTAGRINAGSLVFSNKPGDGPEFFPSSCTVISGNISIDAQVIFNGYLETTSGSVAFSSIGRDNGTGGTLVVRSTSNTNNSFIEAGGYYKGDFYDNDTNGGFTTTPGQAVTAASHGFDVLNILSAGQNVNNINVLSSLPSQCAGTVVSNASIGDRVWLDTNGNGVQDAGETAGVNGVKVRLYNSVGTIIDSTLTNAAGAYSFTGLAAGTYAVGFVTPSGYNISPLDAGGNDATDSDANTSTGKTANFALAASEMKTSVDAGLYQAATIGNFVWYDSNGNGQQDGGESGIDGVTVTLTGPNGSTPVVTSGGGAYSFLNLAPGTYTVTFATPAGYIATNSNTGNDNSDSDPVAGVVSNIVLTSGQTNNTIDAGFVGNMSIGSTVFIDANNDGTQSGAAEIGIAGLTVKLYASNGTTLLKTTTTDGSGNYFFDSLTAGNYVVGVTPNGTQTTSSTVTVATDNGVDGDDNGIQGAAGAETKSAVINLTAGAEPTGSSESFQGGDHDGSGGTADANGDMTIDFGFFAPATIGNFVWYDSNGNGQQDGGESGIDGVTVTLTGPNGSTPVVTSGGGAYSFPNLAPGTYTVTFATPAGYIATTSNTGNDNSDSDPVAGVVSNIVLVSGQTDNTIDAGFVGNMSIGSTVFIDANNDGTQSGAAETGIAGLTVKLYASNGTTLLKTTTTNASGNYFFDSLTAGNYVVGVTPNGTQTTSSTVTVATDNGVDGDDNGIQGAAGAETKSPVINLTAGAEPTGSSESFQGGDHDGSGGTADANGDMTIDFGFFAPATIGNFVWTDTNENGQQDGGESGIDGVTITLTGPNGSTMVTTAGGGAYSFPNLAPGTYTVTFATPAGYIATNSNTGNDNSDSDPVAGVVSNIVLTSGQTNNTIDAGFVGNMSIGSTVFIDANNDGTQSGAAEIGIAGLTVKLYASNGTTLLKTTTTDGSGNYFFDSLTAGNYVVGVTPNGTQTTSSTVTVATDNGVDGDDNGIQGAAGAETKSPVINLTAGAEPTGSSESFQGGDHDGSGGTADANGDMTIDFGFFAPATIGNFVWYDTNGNGQQDGGEPGIDGVTVTLTGPNGSTPVVTSGGGAYSFPNLAPGTYTVTFATPAGYIATTNNTGNDNSDSDPVAGVVNNIVLTSGQTNNTIDAGFVGNMSIGSSVFIDANNDGTQSGAAETGIAGLTVKLYASDGTTLLKTTTTDGSGNYFFDSLTAGNYVVGVTPNGTQTTSSTVTVATDNGVDGDDNGIQGAAGAETKSPVINLTAGAEPTGSSESFQGGDHDGSGSTADANGDMTIDFGFFAPATIGNFVWTDTNENGQQDGGESGIDGVTVTLTGPNGSTPVVTSGGGAYSFPNLAPGTYTVTFATPAGYIATTSNTGNDNTDSDPVAGVVSNIVLVSGQTNNTIDAGYISCPDTVKRSDNVCSGFTFNLNNVIPNLYVGGTWYDQANAIVNNPSAVNQGNYRYSFTLQSGCEYVILEKVILTIPDYTANIVLAPNNIQGITNVKAIITISEINTIENCRQIIVRVPAFQDRYNFNWNSTFSGTVIPGITANNNDWEYLGVNSNFHIWRYIGNNGTFQAGVQKRFVFDGPYNPLGSDGLTSFNVAVNNGSGGETNFANNAASQILTFRK